MDTIKRTFIPGDEWLYFKLYTGPKTADFIIVDVIRPLIKILLKQNHIKKWFFIRYEDPNFHLRVRLLLDHDNSIGEVIRTLNTLCKPYMEDESIWRIQFDTYEREIERYNAKTMSESESLSYYDSEMIANSLNSLDDELKWLFGLKIIDAFLDDFNYNLEKKLSLIEQLKINFCEEFEADKHFKKQLNKKYIGNKGEIEQFLSDAEYQNQEQSFLKEILGNKSVNTQFPIKTIMSKLNQGQLDSFLKSHIHMTMNRLFRSKQRVCEMVIYYFLHKHYKAVLGIKRHYNLYNSPNVEV